MNSRKELAAANHFILIKHALACLLQFYSFSRRLNSAQAAALLQGPGADFTWHSQPTTTFERQWQRLLFRSITRMTELPKMAALKCGALIFHFH